MHMQKLVFGVVVVVMMARAGSAQESDLFNLVSEEPVVASSGSSRDWDGRYTDPGAVLYHDGQFHMFRNGFNGWPASVQVGYLTSPDGITWTEATEDPVLTTDEVAYAEVAALASSALVEDDGTWVLYFYTWDSSSGSNSPATIGRATATEPIGPWTPDPQPVLLPGVAGSWDEKHVSTPRVLKNEAGYVMYYTGYDERGLQSSMIGMATSADGITWTKYDDPSTTEAPFAESDPVVTPFSSSTFIHQPNVQQTPEGWVMIYREAMGRPRTMSLNYALSEDGIRWERALDEPFWTANSIPDSNGFWFTALAYHDDTYYLFVEGAWGAGTSIFAAIHEGALRAN